MGEPTEAGGLAVVRAIRCIIDRDADGMEAALREAQADDPTGFATCYGLATYVASQLAEGEGDRVGVETFTAPAASAFDREVAVTLGAIIAAAGNHDAEGAADAFYGDEVVSGRVTADLFRIAAALAGEAGHA